MKQRSDVVKAKIKDINNKDVGEVEISDEIFGSKVSTPIIYEVVNMQLANRRKGTAVVKNRTDVSGTTAKMYRQKGTGRARHGDARANIFVGGGKAFGPKQRDYRYRPPKKVRRGGIRSALSLKNSEGKLIILDDFPVSQIKTKDVVSKLEKLGVSSGLLVVGGRDEKLEKSIRNAANVKLVRSEGINAYDIMRYEHTIILRNALGSVQEVLKP